ncbi:pentatricopeptide repeat-containing protein, partial [Quercus suber]
MKLSMGFASNGSSLRHFRFSMILRTGYAPDRVMYTTTIPGLCRKGWLGDARKLWFEIIQKGFIPNEYTYSALIHGYFKGGNLKEARNLCKEMCNRGYRETTVSYNTMIAGMCLNGRTNELKSCLKKCLERVLFVILIQGFVKEGKIVESTNLLKELLMQGLQPSTSPFSPLIEKLCEVGDIQEAKKLWDDMQSRGLQPIVCTHELIITGLCNQGYAAEGMDWLLAMLKCKLKPKKETFERLIQCLSQSDKWDDILLVYTWREGICHCLVNKLYKENSHFVETHLGEILVAAIPTVMIPTGASHLLKLVDHEFLDTCDTIMVKVSQAASCKMETRPLESVSLDSDDKGLEAIATGCKELTHLK